MARIKIQLPTEFTFRCQISIRITDINYGGHVGNDAILSLIHEARMQYFKSMGYSEMNFGAHGLIMADAALEFKHELFYGEIVEIAIAATEISRIGFDVIYKIEKTNSEGQKVVALGKTGMICYDYKVGKIVNLAPEAKEKLLRRMLD